jgi:predicted RNA-binding protein with PIN domain
VGARRLVVDGNNVMGVRPDGWWRDRAAATARLAGAIAVWAARQDRAVTVVFDGRRPAGLAAPDAIELLFAGHGGRDAADDVIAALVAEDPRPEEIEVVSSDAGLAERVRAHGAAVSGARAFRDGLG